MTAHCFCCCLPQRFRAVDGPDGTQAELRSGPADESYIRSVLTRILEGVSDVADYVEGIGEWGVKLHRCCPCGWLQR